MAIRGKRQWPHVGDSCENFLAQGIAILLWSETPEDGTNVPPIFVERGGLISTVDVLPTEVGHNSLVAFVGFGDPHTGPLPVPAACPTHVSSVSPAVRRFFVEKGPVIADRR